MKRSIHHASRVHRAMALSALLGGLFGFGAPASAVTTIVNIDGSGPNGAGVATAYAYPLAPGSLVTMVNPVTVDLPAGDYSVSDGWGRSGALYDAWNYESAVAGSWDSHFYVAVQQGTSPVYQLLIDGLSNRDPACTNQNCSWSTEAEASAAFLQTPSFDLNLATATAVSFSSTDFYLLDNLGGISLAVTPLAVPIGTVPEPGEILLLLLSLPVMVLSSRRGRAGDRRPPVARRPRSIGTSGVTRGFA